MACLAVRHRSRSTRLFVVPLARTKWRGCSGLDRLRASAARSEKIYDGLGYQAGAKVVEAAPAFTRPERKRKNVEKRRKQLDAEARPAEDN